MTSVPCTDVLCSFIPLVCCFRYCFPATRLAAISNFRQIFVMTHDSIGLGEDGPTHQPIEALTLCRATPNILVLRPADGAEVIGAYVQALKWNGPSVLALSRQNVIPQKNSSVEGVAKGGYVLHDSNGGKDLDVVIVSSGTEVTTVTEALKNDALKNLKVRVVSMPSTTLFDEQPLEYRRSVIPQGAAVISVEASSVTGWEKYAHASIGMTTFGASGPLEKVLDKFNMSVRTLPGKLQERIQQVKEIAVLNGGRFPPLNTHFEFNYPKHVNLIAH
jgi:transketolase